MYRFPLVAVSVLVAWCVGVQDEKPPTARDLASKQELQRIQGSWQFVSLVDNGEKTAEAELKDRTIFCGGDAFIVRSGEHFVQAGSQKLDPSKSPKSINIMISQGDRKGDILLGIYELDGDTFKVCFDTEGQERPTEFKSEQGSGKLLVVYKRIQARDEPKPAITGEYTSVIRSGDGSEQTADVEIEKRGDGYLLTWRRGNATISSGIALRAGNVLSVSWGTQSQSGVAVYQIEQDRKMLGRYTTMGGIGLVVEESLIPKKRID
jgi:uncharacterized protein (TIGR03067 family)